MFLESVKTGVIGQIMAPLTPSQNIFYLYLLSAFVISVGTYVYFSYREAAARPEGISKGLFGYIFDRKVWLHRSAIQDYLFFIANSLIYYGIVAHFMISGHIVYEALGPGFDALFGVRDTPLFAPSALSALGYTLAVILAIDFAIYLTHYIQHRVAALWHFHAVHHSAEVLTVVTVYRQHPVDLFFTGTIMVLLAQLAFALFSYLTMAEPSEISILNINVVLFTFLLVGYNLRHSHIWLSYPPWLSYIFISPAQHQTHHSIDEKHFDRNFGFIFAIWDWLFGTLYVPQGYEKLEFGLSRDEPNPFNSITDIYLKPFRNSWREIRTTFSKGRAALSGRTSENVESGRDRDIPAE